MEEKKRTTLREQFQNLSSAEDLPSIIFETGIHEGKSYLEVREKHPSYLVYLHEKNIEYRAWYLMESGGVMGDDFNLPYPYLSSDKNNFLTQGWNQNILFYEKQIQLYKEKIESERQKGGLE